MDKHLLSVVQTMKRRYLSPEILQRALGKTIRRERSDQGLSQEAFADLVGLHRTYIGSVERGERNLTFRNLALISSALGYDVSELMAIVEKPSPERAP